MKCDLCKSDNWVKTAKLAKCSNCGFVRAADKYFDIDIKTIYDDTYYNKGDYFDYKLEEDALKINFKYRLKIIKSYVPKGRLLEIGSAYGYFLELADKNYEAEGIECNKSLENIYNAKSLKAQFKPLEEATIENDSYDLIVSLDTIEHVKSPTYFVKQCFKALKPGGYCFIETGDIEALLPKIQKEKWRLVHPPEHLSYLSSKTIKLLFQQNGFDVIKILKVPFARSISQIIFRMFPAIFNNIPQNLVNKLPNINLSINTYDLIFVVARKKT